MSVTITIEFITEHTNISGGINSSQCTILGLVFATNLVKGWKRKVKGRVISDASAELFKRLNGAKGLELQKAIIDEFKNEQKTKTATL